MSNLSDLVAAASSARGPATKTLPANWLVSALPDHQDADRTNGNGFPKTEKHVTLRTLSREGSEQIVPSFAKPDIKNSDDDLAKDSGGMLCIT